jgi:hypothetical protein
MAHCEKALVRFVVAVQHWGGASATLATGEVRGPLRPR